MTKHFIVKGKVQGVAYRYYTKQYADQLGLLGSVENKNDGSVEVYINGNKEELEMFEKSLRKGSPYCHVESIEGYEVDFIDFKEFRIII